MTCIRLRITRGSRGLSRSATTPACPRRSLRRRNEEGQVIILFALFSFVLVGALALSLDVDYLLTERRPADREPLTVRNPIAVIEVLSPTTSLTDHREKAIYYRQMPSLLCYLLVEQDERRIERYWRPDADAEWHHELVIGRTVQFSGIEFELSLDEIYEGIEFDPPS